MMDVIELIEALKTADGETAMELVERLQCGKVDCSALSANGVEAVASEVIYRWRALDFSGYCYGSNPPKNLPKRCDLTAFYHPAPPSVAVPEGWKLVPIEPTDKMMLVGGFSFAGKIPNDHVYPAVKELWAKMLSEVTAAPQPDHSGDANKVADDLPGMWDQSDLSGGETDVPVHPRHIEEQ